MIAYDLAAEIWDGKWAHISELKSKPVTECEQIISELSSRAPGFKLEQYKKTMALAMQETR